jgi:NDP-sugar pyrophosphorylase family protein
VTGAKGPVGALLLAAGRGDRLRPLTDVIPKPCLPMPGAPLGAWMLELLLERFEAVAVNCSHLAPSLIAQLSLEGRAEALVERPEPFGTAGTLAGLRSRVRDRIVVANADVVADVDMDEVLARHATAAASATVVVIPVSENADFRLSEEGRVEEFVDRRGNQSIAGARFIGVSVYEREVLNELPSERPIGLGETILARLASRGDLAAHVHHGYAADVGTRCRYVDTCSDVLGGVAPPPPSGPYGAYGGRLVEVEGGRAFVADSATCDESSLGRGAVVLAGANVSPRASLQRCVVWSHETVPPEARLEDCVWFRGRALRLN